MLPTITVGRATESAVTYSSDMHASVSGSRRAVTAELAAALRLAIDRAGPRTLVITAGPGSGKTHTIDRLVGDLDIATRRVTADELSWRQPYAVIATLLDIPIPVPIPAGFAVELEAAVDSLCASEPQLLVIDDVHHADSGSLEVLGALAAATDDLPLVILLARRHLPTREMLNRLIARRSVREWQLPVMDDADLEVLVDEVVGARPDGRLIDRLRRSGGNPMHALALLDDLRARGELTTRADGDADGLGARVTIASVGEAEPSTSLHAVIREQLALLDDRSRALVHTLAVWGGPATLDEIAALDGTSASALVGVAQTTVDAGVVAVSSGGTMTFTHDVYADVAYDGLAPALRSVLHTAIARHHDAAGNRQLVAHHVLAAGSDNAAAVSAITRAHHELAHVPAVAVDLLDAAAHQRSIVESPIRTLELDLATALARSGQFDRSAEVAEQGLAKAGDLATIAQLYRILLFTLIAQGKSTRVLELTAATLRMPVDATTRAALVGIQRYVGILGGAGPVPTTPHTYPAPGTVADLVTEGLRRFLAGDGEGGLELTLEASRREGATERQDSAPELSTSADLWPPFIEHYVHGPAAADALLDHAIRLRTDRGAAWMTAYHDFTRGGIALGRGRLDDAAASLDVGLERAAAAGMGWTSLAQGARAMVDILRGEFSAAATRLDTFAASGLPNQFGLPVPEQAQMLLLEAQRKLRPAVAVAGRCWSAAVEMGLYGWLPSLAVDCARIAQRADDRALLERVVAGLADIPEPVPPARVGPIALAGALATGDTAAVISAAVACARAAHDLGDAIVEVQGWEEAACAAAGTGDKAAAREYARHALLLTAQMDAPTLSARVTSRLRALGLRLDARSARERPRSGWNSLTRTEVTVAELVASGLNGAEIAQRLYISQRTVQTHVSNALTKLDLRTRVELAALAVARKHADASPVVPGTQSATF